MDERSVRWERRFEWPMVVAALLVIPLLGIEESGLGGPWPTVRAVLDYVTWLAFAAELVVMVAVTPRPLEWVRRHPLDVAVVLLTPPFLPGDLEAARLFRLLRVLRLVRLFSLRSLLSLEGVRYAAFLSVFTVVVGGAAFAAVEEPAPGGEPVTAWDGIWWALTTVTTVGYGDLPPRSDAGRALGAVVMLVGIGFVALITAFVAERFVRQEAAEHDREVVAELRAIRERLDRLEGR